MITSERRSEIQEYFDTKLAPNIDKIKDFLPALRRCDAITLFLILASKEIDVLENIVKTEALGQLNAHLQDAIVNLIGIIIANDKNMAGLN